MESVLVISSILLWFAVLINIVLTLTLIRWANSFQKQTSPNVDMLKASDIIPNSTLETLMGEQIQLASFLNNWLLAVFVSPTCDPCRQKMPLLKEIYPDIRRKNGEMVVVSIGDPEKTAEFVQEFDLAPLPVLVTSYGSDFARDYKIMGTPSYYLINHESRIEMGGFFDENWEQLVMQRISSKIE